MTIKVKIVHEETGNSESKNIDGAVLIGRKDCPFIDDRDPGNHVSREHLMIADVDGFVVIEDMSTNGSTVQVEQRNFPLKKSKAILKLEEQVIVMIPGFVIGITAS